MFHLVSPINCWTEYFSQHEMCMKNKEKKRVQKHKNHVWLIRFACSSWEERERKRRRKKRIPLIVVGFGQKSFNFYPFNENGTKLINHGWRVHKKNYNEKLLSSSMSWSCEITLTHTKREKRNKIKRWIALFLVSERGEDEKKCAARKSR